MFSLKRLITIGIFLTISMNVYGQEVIERYSGSGGQNISPFTVTDAWEVNWDAKGDIFQLYLYNSEGNMEGVVANQQGPGEGSSYQPQTGRYYFKVNAMGNWTIEITKAEQTVTNSGSGEVASYSGSGAKNTRPVTIDGSWELQWDTNGDIFQVYLYTKDGSMVEVLANQQGSGTRSSYYPQGGSYYFKVNAMGEWSMKIVSSN